MLDSMLFVAEDGRLICDICAVDDNGWHDIEMLAAGAFCCATCGWPAHWSGRYNRWFVFRPFIIVEEPW